MLRSIAAIASLLALPLTAQAQERPTAEQIREAQTHFEQGTLAFERGDYSEAAAEFEAAYELTHHADLLYNVYSAQERNGQLQAAATALEGYLRDGSPDEARRGALDLRLERLRARVAEQRAQEADAVARETEADARLRREQTEREAAERRASGERESRLSQARGGHATADGLTIVGVVAMIAAAAGAVSFGIFAGLSESEDQELASRCGRDAGVRCRPEDVEMLGTYNTAADVSLIVAGGLAMVGGAMLLIALGVRPSDSVEQAWLSPEVGPDRAGFSAGARF